MRALALCAMALACAGCTSLQAMISPPPDPAIVMPALELRIAILVAEERQKLDTNAKPLMLDPELAEIARKRAADMASKNYFAHTAPNGDTSATLLMAADTHFQGLLGENMAAQHYTKAGGIDVNGFARRFVDTWLASPPHRQNLSFTEYNHTGIGAAMNGDMVYVTELFSTDMGMGPHKDGTPPLAITPLASPQAATTGNSGSTAPAAH